MKTLRAAAKLGDKRARQKSPPTIPPAPALDRIRLSQKACIDPAASPPATHRAALRASAPPPARIANTSGGTCTCRPKTAKEKFGTRESEAAAPMRPPNALAPPQSDQQPLTNRRPSPRYLLRSQRPSCFLAPATRPTRITRRPHRASSASNRRCLLAWNQLHQLLHERRKLSRRHRSPRMDHHIPPRAHLMPMHAYNFPQAPADSIAHHRIAQRLLDAPSKPADRESIRTYKQRELAARSSPRFPVHQVVLRPAHNPAFARKIQPRRVRRA